MELEISAQSGQLASPELSASHGSEWVPGDVLQASIGQSETMATPLQLASYAATIANKGVRMKPHLVKSIHSYSFEEVLQQTQPEVACDMKLEPEIFDIVTEGMERMAEYGFAGYPIRVATKTGTPQTYGNFTNSTYISFAPADDPQIAVAVVVEKGGGEVCTPIVRKIYDFYFGLDQTDSTGTEQQLLLQ